MHLGAFEFWEPYWRVLKNPELHKIAFFQTPAMELLATSFPREAGVASSPTIQWWKVKSHLETPKPDTSQIIMYP